MNSTGVQSSLEQLVAANEDAASFFRAQLLARDRVGPRDYLISRGFTALLDDTRWTVGFAPGDWTALHEHLSGLGYSDQVQYDAGLVFESRRGKPLDRFRSRITFGIRNADDELVGFSARSAPGAAGHVPKYLNTPSTQLYDKKCELFGLGELRRGRPHLPLIAVVEGPLDAIAVDLATRSTHSAGTAVALCGTAFTTEQAQLISAQSPSAVLVLLDGDTAGRRAREIAYFRLSDHVEQLLCSPMPSGSDPAALLASCGGSSLLAQLESSRLLADQLVDDRPSTWPDLHESAEREICCLRETAQLVARMRPQDLTRQAGRLPVPLRLSQRTVTAELIESVSHRTASLSQAVLPRD